VNPPARDQPTHQSESERDDIRRSVQQWIRDIELGRFEEYDADGLRGLASQLVGRSAKKAGTAHQSGMTPT